MKFAKAVSSKKAMSIILACMTVLFGLFIIYQLGKVGKEGATNQPLDKVQTQSVAVAKSVAKTLASTPKPATASATLQNPETAKASAKKK
jgi:hypothetical protein